jgi:large subunit ribosomal protein L31e
VSEEKKVVLTREYVINLRRAYEVSRSKRAKYAVGLSGGLWLGISRWSPGR